MVLPKNICISWRSAFSQLTLYRWCAPMSYTVLASIVIHLKILCWDCLMIHLGFEWINVQMIDFGVYDDALAEFVQTTRNNRSLPSEGIHCVGAQGTSQSITRMTSASFTSGCVDMVTPRYASWVLRIHISEPTVSTTSIGSLSQSDSSKGGAWTLRPRKPVNTRGRFARVNAFPINSVSRLIVISESFSNSHKNSYQDLIRSLM